MKILIVNNNLDIGGIQKSLVNLLGEIHSKHDVTLFLFSDSGKLKKDVPEDVKIIRGNRFVRLMGITNAEAKSEGMFTYLLRSFFTVLTRIFGTRVSFGILSRMQRLSGEYDVAVSFMQNGAYRVFYGGCNEFAVNGVRAKTKVAFVHCDFLNYEGNSRYNRKFYSKFDKIACVSESTRKRFIDACKIDGNRVQSVYNCYDYKKIKELSHKYAAEYTDGILNIFSASRIGVEKGIVRMVRILKELKDEGYRFVWRIAGDGAQTDVMKKLIKEYGLENDIVLLGMLDNPYPYFASSDLLLVPSYNEAAPMVFGEAMITGIPVLTTDTTSAKEMVEDTHIGFVCKVDDESIKAALEKILSGKIKRNEIPPYTNEAAVSEFYEIIGCGGK